MDEQQQSAVNFLSRSNAKMTIRYVGRDINKMWNESESRDKYSVSIKTPRGRMNITFWDSLYNTRKNKKALIYNFDDFINANNEPQTKPSCYDILSCLTKYDVGTLEDFMSEFGYDADNREEEWRVKSVYNATRKEYDDLCRIFSDEELEQLREIN